MGCLTELAPISELGTFGNLYIRRIVFEAKGQVLPAHRHNFDHATFIGRGTVQVKFFKTDGTASLKTFEGPTWFEVPATVGHEMRALTVPVEAFCVFAMREPNGEVADVITAAHLDDQFAHFREGRGE